MLWVILPHLFWFCDVMITSWYWVRLIAKATMLHYAQWLVIAFYLIVDWLYLVIFCTIATGCLLFCIVLLLISTVCVTNKRYMYNWEFVLQCSVTCGGGGSQQRMVQCQLPNGELLPSSNCLDFPPPVSQACGHVPCSPSLHTPRAPQWQKGAWSSVSQTSIIKLNTTIIVVHHYSSLTGC